MVWGLKGQLLQGQSFVTGSVSAFFTCLFTAQLKLFKFGVGNDLLSVGGIILADLYRAFFFIFFSVSSLTSTYNYKIDIISEQHVDM